MKIVSLIAGILLGLVFLASSIPILFHLVKIPAPPDGSPVALFMGAFVPTGYLTFVKAFELLGGLLVMIPKTRNFGLLVLGPIILNILAFHIFIAKGGFADPMLIMAVGLSLFLLVSERKAFAGLLH